MLPCNIVADCFQNWCTSGRGYSSQTFKQSRTSACVYEVCSSLLGWLCYARSARKYHSGFAAAANRQMSPAACALLSSGHAADCYFACLIECSDEYIAARHWHTSSHTTVCFLQQKCSHCLTEAVRQWMLTLCHVSWDTLLMAIVCGSTKKIRAVCCTEPACTAGARTLIIDMTVTGHLCCLRACCLHRVSAGPLGRPECNRMHIEGR